MFCWTESNLLSLCGIISLFPAVAAATAAVVVIDVVVVVAAAANTQI